MAWKEGVASSSGCLLRQAQPSSQEAEGDGWWLRNLLLEVQGCMLVGTART